MAKVSLKKGECIGILKKMPEKSVDMIFADPPYNLSGKNHVTCVNGRKVKCDKGVWDMVEDIDKFNTSSNLFESVKNKILNDKNIKNNNIIELIDPIKFGPQYGYDNGRSSNF